MRHLWIYMLTEIIALDRPLVAMDLETTGVHPSHDRIVQIGIVKLRTDGSEKEWSTLVNPGMPIPPEATDAHHITDAMVANAPTFAQVAPGVAKGLEGCDLCGYNLAFDVRFLAAEFRRVPLPFDEKQFRVIDGFKIFTRVSPRNLEVAGEAYAAEYLERLKARVPDDRAHAHDALYDARLSLRVIEGQLRKHEDLPRTVVDLHRLFFETPAANHVDAEGKLAWRNGQVVLNFGAHAGTSLREAASRKTSVRGAKRADCGYLRWILNGEFSASVKRHVADALEGRFATRATEPAATLAPAGTLIDM